MTDINYAQIRQMDVANGEGIRTSLFVSGCKFNCKDCFNKEYQDFNYGNKFTKEIEDLIISYLKSNNISGLSILGGDPFCQNNEDLWVLYKFLKRVKNETNKSVWLWSGFTWEQIQYMDFPLDIVRECVDVFVDGLFVEELKDMRLRFRGSSNQRVIDVNESVKNNEVIKYLN